MLSNEKHVCDYSPSSFSPYPHQVENKLKQYKRIPCKDTRSQGCLGRQTIQHSDPSPAPCPVFKLMYNDSWQKMYLNFKEGI